MSGFKQFNLSDVLVQIGEERIRSILSSFECPLNKDVESFLKSKAIEFSKRGFAKTYLIYWQDECKKVLVGYYTIAIRHFSVVKKSLSSRMFSKIKQHGIYDSANKAYIISAPLIAQLGKNFKDGNHGLISGDEILQMAVDRIYEIQKEIGGKFLYLECEDKAKLIQFYEKNGFVSFGKRKLDKDETDLQGTYLIQLLQYHNHGK